MDSNPLKLDMYDLVRRAVASALSNTPVKEWKTLLPEYTVTLPLGFPGKNTRELSTLSTKQHGKRRVYSDTTSNSSSALHLFYVSKKDMIRLTGKTFGEVIDMFSNRWCLSVSQPAIVCKSFVEFIRGVVCIETDAARRNHPISGSTNREWKFGPYIGKILKKNVAIVDPSTLVCQIQKRR